MVVKFLTVLKRMQINCFATKRTLVAYNSSTRKLTRRAGGPMLASVRLCVLAALLGLMLLAPRAAHAQNCKNLSATPVAFGTYDVFATSDLTGTGTISYSCPPPLFPVVSLSASSNGAYQHRQMTLGANTLDYELYSDAAMTTVWGVGADTHAVPQGNNNTVSVFGKLFQQQDAAIGGYSDTITVTFNF
jgi:spore coat protein U-like protein